MMLYDYIRYLVELSSGILDEILIRVYMYSRLDLCASRNILAHESRRDLCGSPDPGAAVGLDKLRFL